MSSTITRTSLTDDDGTGLTGTVINNALWQSSIYDAIDALFAATLVLGADLSVADQLVVGSGSVSATAKALITGSLSPAAGADGHGLRVAPTLVEAGSGTHALLAGAALMIPTITAGSGAVTNAATLYIEGPPAGTVTGLNLALWVDAGIAKFDGPLYASDGLVTAPGYAFTSNPDTGVYLVGSTVFVGIDNQEAFSFSDDGNAFLFELRAAGHGTGSKYGNVLRIGRNSSGSGAAGCLSLEDLNGVTHYLWVDATGDLRIGSAPPEEDGSPSDTSGTVVGTQS